MPGLSQRVMRFGAFEVDLDRVELRKQGVRIRLQEQPFQVLIALLEKPGEVVTREELIRRIWSDATVVDFDRGLNAAVTRLRQALSDSAEAPRYVETVARRGYRFVGYVEKVQAASEDSAPSALERVAPAPAPPARVRMPFAVIPVVLLALAGVWWLFIRPGEAKFAVALKVAPLTGAAGIERHPSFSPDGTQLVYEWDRGDGRTHLYIKVVGAGDPVALTSGSGSEYGPAWSPDGKWIAFLGAQDRSAVGVFVVAAVGGTPRKVAEIAPIHYGILRRPYRRLDWTRDSSHLIVSAPRSGFGDSLLLVSTVTDETRWLTAAPVVSLSGDREPALSPDGASVVFARGMPDNEALYMLSLTPDFRPSGDPWLISAAGSARSPAWLPVGRRLIFTSLEPQVMAGFELSWMDLDAGRPPRLLPELGRRAAMPAISRQGRIAYADTIAEGHIWRQDIPSPGKTAPPPVIVTSAAAIQLYARYSPDGSRIAFASDRSGWREIWNCGADGGPCIQVTSFRCACLAAPRWSPDGNRLVFAAAANGHEDVYVVDANGGAPRHLTAEGPRGSFPYWSRDGRWIYYSREGDRQVLKIPVTGGKAVPLSSNPGALVEESADLKSLYYMRGDNLYRSAPDGAGEGLVVSGVAFTGFAVAEDRIYYLHEPSPGKMEIRQRLLATGEDSRVVTVEKQVTGGLSLSPDGKSLIYSELRVRSSLMVAENLD